MNQTLADSVYPVTPQGATERVRLNEIVIAATQPGDHLAHDGNWFLADDVRNPDVNWYTYEEDIDWGLVHELSHQIAIIDLYASNVNPVNVHVLDGEGLPSNFGFEWANGGLMVGGDTAPHNNPHLYSSHSAGGISSTKGYRSNYYGAYQYDIPAQNHLQVLDNQGNPANGVHVALYQRSGPFSWVGLPTIDNVAEISGTTGTDGRFTLTNRSAHGGTTTRVGQELRDNPFGLIDIVGTQNVFLIKLSVEQHVEFHWLDITQLNLAYWMGDTISHTFTISSHIPPSAAPEAPQAVRARTRGSHASLSWNPSPSPGVVGYRVYRAIPPDYRYVQASGLVSGTSFEEEMGDGEAWLGHCVYAVTAVGSGGLESGFSNLVYAPSLHPVRDIALSSDGTRVVLDPWNPYPLFRQQSDGRYTHRLAAPWHGFFNARFLAIDANERLLISDAGDAWSDHRPVRVFDRDGNPLFGFGERGSGPGQLGAPTGVASWGKACNYGRLYPPDEHTLLQLRFDGDYRGVDGEPGTAHGTSFVQGRYGEGVLVDDSDTLTYATPGNLNRTAGAIEFWVQPTRAEAGGEIHVFFEINYMDTGIQIVRHGGGNLHFLIFTPTSLTDIYAPTGHWRSGEWHHVAATWQDNRMNLYVDGLDQASSHSASPPETLGEIFNVGSAPGGIWQANAVLDELRISDIPRLGNSDTCGRILVADAGNHRLQVFDSMGYPLSTYGSQGSAPGQFREPQGLAVDPAGRVIVADKGNDRLQVLGFDGATLRSLDVITAGLRWPTNIAVDNVGRIVVADTGNNAIKVLDAVGRLQATFAAPNDGSSGPFREPLGVAVDANGTIVVADSANQRVVMVYGPLLTERTWIPLVARSR
jgi:sugar lactone lactonase YvrE